MEWLDLASRNPGPELTPGQGKCREKWHLYLSILLHDHVRMQVMHIKTRNTMLSCAFDWNEDDVFPMLDFSVERHDHEDNRASVNRRYSHSKSPSVTNNRIVSCYILRIGQLHVVRCRVLKSRTRFFYNLVGMKTMLVVWGSPHEFGSRLFNHTFLSVSPHL